VQKGFHQRAKGKGKVPGKGGVRYYKSVGLGFKTPREAIEGASAAPPGVTGAVSAFSAALLAARETRAAAQLRGPAAALSA
jgi:hypothetical protein